MLKFLSILSILLSVLSLKAEDVLFNQISVEDGLSSNSAYSICKDSWGYVWVGSLEGLDRYDGWELKSYNDYFPEEIRKVKSIAEDANHVLWIGTEFGLYSWDRVSSTFQKASHALLSHSSIRHIESSGDKVFVCSDKGVFMISASANAIEKLVFHRSVEDRITRSTSLEIVGDQLFIALDGALVQYDFENKSSIVHTKDHLLGVGSSLSLDFTCMVKKGSKLYLGTHSDGVFCYDLDGGEFYALDGYEECIILSISCHDDKLYVGTDSNGLKVGSLHQGGTVLESYFATEAVYSILLDDNNALWLGTYSSGVYYASLYEKAFKPVVFAQGEELEGVNVRSLYSTGEECFIGTRDGLYIVDNDGNVRHLTSENSALDAKVILTIFPFGSTLLIGTYGGGVFEYNPENKELRPWRQDLFGAQCVYAFATDGKGNLWLTTLEGLVVIKYGKPLFFDSNNCDLKSNLIYSLDIDSKDRIWVGTMRGAYVFSYGDGVLTLLTDFPYVPKSKVTQFYQNNDDMYVLTENQGIYHFDADLNLLDNMTTDDGLCHNSVSSIIRADDDKCLITTLKGVSLYDESDSSFVNYHLSDGLPSLAFNSGAILKDRTEAIWVGSTNGLRQYKRQVEEDYLGTNIVITDLYVGGQVLGNEQRESVGKSIEEIDEFSLRGNNNIGFRFVNINVHSLVDRQFLVKLEYNDHPQEWEFVGDRTTVHYRDLRAGTHVFSVKSANSSSTIIRQIKVRVYPRWYGVWSVLMGVVLFFVLGFYVFRKMRVEPELVETKVKYSTSHLSSDKSKSILLDVDRYVEEFEVFLNAELKIRDVAAATEHPIRDISQAINQNLGEGFTDYINRYRVGELKKRLSDPQYRERYTLLAIARGCGFNSKSSFYRAFKKETGKTPAEYWNGNV